MSFEIEEVTLIEVMNHLTLTNRVVASASARLRETRDGRVTDHALTVRVRVNVREGMSSRDVRLALLDKATEVFRRTTVFADRPTI